MQKKSYNAPTVPWYAHRDTKPLRPKPPRALPEEILKDRAGKERYMQALYRWIRANWQAGDYFYILPDAPDAPTYCVADRYGIFKEMKPQGNLSRIFVDWLDDGHRINMEVKTFYKYAVKLDQEGNHVELPPVTPEALCKKD